MSQVTRRCTFTPATSLGATSLGASPNQFLNSPCHVSQSPRPQPHDHRLNFLPSGFPRHAHPSLQIVLPSPPNLRPPRRRNIPHTFLDISQRVLLGIVGRDVQTLEFTRGEFRCHGRTREWRHLRTSSLRGVGYRKLGGGEKADASQERRRAVRS